MLLLVTRRDVIPLLHTLALICKPAAEAIRRAFHDEIQLARPCRRLPQPQSLTWLGMMAACEQLRYETRHLICRAVSGSVVVLKLMQVRNALVLFTRAAGEEPVEDECVCDERQWSEQAVVATAVESLAAFCCGRWVAAIAPSRMGVPYVPWEMDSVINDMIDERDEFISNDREMVEFMLHVIMRMHEEFSARLEYMEEKPPKRCKVYVRVQ